MKSCHLCKTDYEEVKDRLSMRQVAEFYGYKVQRGNVCLCPFHNDTHPSMKIYPDDKGFYCWVCQKGGDVIKFVGLLYGLKNEEACKRLIDDFSLPICMDSLSYREKRERQKQQSKYREIEKFKKKADGILREYRKLLCDAANNYSSFHFDEALQELSIVEYRLECIKNNPEQYMSDRRAVKQLGEIQRRIDQWDKQTDSGGSVPG